MIDTNEREEFEGIVRDVLAEYLNEKQAQAVRDNLTIELEEHGLLEVVEPDEEPEDDAG